MDRENKRGDDCQALLPPKLLQLPQKMGDINHREAILGGFGPGSLSGLTPAPRS